MGVLRRFSFAFFLAGAIGAVPLRADADPALTWVASTGCPPGAEEQLAAILDGHKQSHVAARVEVTPEGTGVKLVVRLQRGAAEQQRVLMAPTCALATEAAAFFLLLSLTPDDATPALNSAVVAAPAASSPPELPATDPTLAPPSHTPSASTSEHPASGPGASPRRFAIGVFGAVEAGVLPSASASFGGALAFRPHRFIRLEADGDYSVSQQDTLASGPGGSFSLLGLGARGCVPLDAGALEVAPCVGARVEEISGAGVQVDVARRARQWLWGPEAGVVLRFSLAPAVGLRLGAFASVPVSRQRFVIDSVGVVDQPWPVALRVALGPEVRF